MSAPTIDSLKVGETLYDVHRERAGNTTISIEGVWECYVREVGTEDGRPWALISWNGNPPSRYWRVPKGWRRVPKEWVRGYASAFGRGDRRGRECALCDAFEHQGHAEACEHPRAVSKRKKAALS